MNKTTLGAFWELTKPDITLLVLITTLVGYILGASQTTASIDFILIFHLILGSALSSAGVSSLNEYLEAGLDAQMKRTKNRPIPSGKIKSSHALFLGVTVSILGVSELLIFVNPFTGLLSLATILLYLFVYTPMKRKSELNTLVGAIPGALPSLGGWVAATGSIGVGAWILFGILFFWQIPHFLSIAWLYREDYGKAGFKMITTGENFENRLKWHIGIFTLAMVITSLLPAMIGLLGVLYFVGMLIAGGVFLIVSIKMIKQLNNSRAKKLLLTSIVYQPVILFLIIFDLFFI